MLENETCLEDGAVPDISDIDTQLQINMSSQEDNASTFLDFFNQLNPKQTNVLENVTIKEEPLTEEDFRALQKDRQKKDSHNISKFYFK